MIPLLLLLACGAPEPLAAEPPASAVEGIDLDPLPDDSLYQLGLPLEDHRGQRIGLDVHRGHPVVVTMFYAWCPAACPMLIEDVKAFERALAPAERAGLRVLMVSLDPARDDPAKLAEAVATHGVDGARWTLARTAPEEVRTVAAALGIRYRAAPDGEMNHSSILTLLDAEGRPVARMEGLRRDPAPLLDALRALPGR